MAYFSSGSEGEVLDAQCMKCKHGAPEACCPVWLLQHEWNYSQGKNSDQKMALDLLIPQKTLCYFFDEKPLDTQD